jgi:uncharacterized repeat protein (TIGR01451 family)
MKKTQRNCSPVRSNQKKYNYLSLNQKKGWCTLFVICLLGIKSQAGVFREFGTISLSQVYVLPELRFGEAALCSTDSIGHGSKEVDLTLKKNTPSRIIQLTDLLTYTLKVWNESENNATGVEVLDNISTTVEFQEGSFVISRGRAIHTGTMIHWIIGSIAAKGDTATLTYQVKALQDGVHFNTAEISKVNEKDIDSTPGNRIDTEDDMERQCFTVPIKLCQDESVEVNVLPVYTNVHWFRNGHQISLTGNSVLLSETGSYTYTADNWSCFADGCCPIIIEPDTTCPEEELSIQEKLKKVKKEKK